MSTTHPTESNTRWLILGLSMLTNAMVAAAPSMALPVLFDEISQDLGLSLLQLGWVWGISALPSILSSFFGGAIGDRFGPRRILILACLLNGLAGAGRGWSQDFFSMAATMFLFGLLNPLVTANNLKICSQWFSARQLGLASGILSMGMALGFLLGSMLSAAVLSPWLGGWRNVLFLYGMLSMLLAIPWYFLRVSSPTVKNAASGHVSMGQAMRQVARLRNTWLLGLTILGFNGCVQGLLGYLPLYLRGLDWSAAQADSALASFHTLSMIFVLPIALGSDRLGSRKKLLLAAALVMLTSTGLLSLVQGGWIWAAVLTAGLVRDGFMAIFITMIVETEGVGPTYAGTAFGFVMIFSGLGSLVSPPLGNSLAAITPQTPFILWAGLALAGAISIFFVQDRPSAHKTAQQPANTSPAISI